MASARGDTLDAHAREAIEELRSIADLVRWGAARLDEARVVFGHGTDNALDEALVLVSHAVGLRPGNPEALYTSRLTSRERCAAVHLIVRRIRERAPAAYLTGRAWFAGLELACDARALVPRSPIAEWIERGFEPWLDPDAVERVLEIGTGGGAIAIACAMAFPGATIDAVDICDTTLALARENCMAHGVDGRIRLLKSDVYSEVRGRYDLIVSNPPTSMPRRWPRSIRNIATSRGSGWRRAPTASTVCVGSWLEQARICTPAACWCARWVRPGPRSSGPAPRSPSRGWISSVEVKASSS